MLQFHPKVYLPLLAGVLLVVLALLVQASHPLNIDSAWYLVAAEAWVHDGLPLYERTAFDPNPPMVLLLSAAIVRVADVLGAAPYTVLRFFTALVLSAGAVTSYVALRQQRLARGFVSLLSLAFLAWSLSTHHREFGQRDHLVMALLFPYVCLFPASAAQHRSATRFIAGLMLGLGLCLKPHYAIVPALFAVLRITPRWRGPLVRIEELVGAVVVGVYLAATWVFFPSLFAVAMPMIAEAYNYQSIPFAERQYTSLVIALGMAFAITLYARRRALPEHSAEAETLVVFGCVCLGLLVAFMLQVGYTYQATPTLILARVTAVGGVALILTSYWPTQQPRIVAGATALVSMLALVRYQRDYAYDDWGETRERLQLFAKHRAIANLSVYMQPVFPAIIYSHSKFAGRFPELWLLPRILDQSEQDTSGAWRPRPNVAHLDAFLRQAVLDDFVLHQPTLVLVDAPGELKSPLTKRADLLAYFLQDARFRSLWDGYRACGGMENVVAYCR